MVHWRSCAAACSCMRLGRETNRATQSGNAHGHGRLAAQQEAVTNYRRFAARRPFMKVVNNLKVPFGTAKMLRVTGAKYLAWEDAFEVDFEDGLSFLEPHSTIRKANKILPKAQPVRVELDEKPCIGFFVHYDNGQTAEVSWSFIRELP